MQKLGQSFLASISEVLPRLHFASNIKLLGAPGLTTRSKKLLGTKASLPGFPHQAIFTAWVDVLLISQTAAMRPGRHAVVKSSGAAKARSIDMK